MLLLLLLYTLNNQKDAEYFTDMVPMYGFCFEIKIFTVPYRLLFYKVFENNSSRPYRVLREYVKRKYLGVVISCMHLITKTEA